MKFSEMRYERPDIEAARFFESHEDEFDEILNSTRGAKHHDSWFWIWKSTRQHFDAYCHELD